METVRRDQEKYANGIRIYTEISARTPKMAIFYGRSVIMVWFWNVEITL